MLGFLFLALKVGGQVQFFALFCSSKHFKHAKCKFFCAQPLYKLPSLEVRCKNIKVGMSWNFQAPSSKLGSS